MSGKRNWGDNMTDRMDRHMPPEPFERERPFPSRKWKLKYECKRTKGDHDFRIECVRISKWARLKEDGTYPQTVYWKCKACGKLEHEFNAPQHKFDKYREPIGHYVEIGF